MKSGDNCPACPFGVLRVSNSRPRGEHRVRYLKCDTCDAPPLKVVLPEASVRRRREYVSKYLGRIIGVPLFSRPPDN